MKHPDYDIDFKPAIALFDWDQTHDMCYFYRKVEIANDQCPLIDDSPIVAIDRYVPDNVAWCENWADHYFELNKHFNYCPFNYISRDSEKFDRFELTDKFDPNVDYFVTLTKGKWVITYLSREQHELILHPDGKAPQFITTYTRKKKIVNVTKTTEYNLTKFCNQQFLFLDIFNTVATDKSKWKWVYYNTFTPNSFVFSKDGQITKPNILYSPKFMFYDDIETYFNYVKSEVEKYINNGNNYPEEKYYPLGKYAKSYTTTFSDFYTVVESKIEYADLPKSMRNHCSLVRANNDKWNNQTPLGDLGVNIPSFNDGGFWNLIRIPRNTYYSLPSMNRSHTGSYAYNMVANFLGDYFPALYAEMKINNMITKTIMVSDISANTSIINVNAPWRGYEIVDSYLINKNVYVPFVINDYFVIEDKYKVPTGISAKASPYSFSKIVIGVRELRGKILDKWDRMFAFAHGCKKIIYHYIDSYNTVSDVYTSTLPSQKKKCELTYYFEQSNNNYEVFDNQDFTNGFELKLEYEWMSDQEFKDLFTYFQNNYLLPEEIVLNWIKENVIMPDSIAIKEIHACLGAGEFAYSQKDPPIPAYMHIARKLDYVAKALGINFDLSGEILSTRQSKHLNRGDTIPAGWYLGQFGRNEGGSTNLNAQQGGFADEERLGIVYEVKGNRFESNQASGDEEIVQGGYILCESIPQLWHIMLQDLDRSLGLQTLGSVAIANPNYNPDYSGNNEEIKTPYWKYNGLGQLILDLMYLSGDTNRHAAQANIGSLKAQAVAGEILAAIGVPATEKSVMMRVDDNLQSVKYPAFNASGQTIADLLIWILQNLAVQNEG